MRVRNFARSFEINFENFTIEAVVDFFATLHVDLTVSIKRSELTIECFWTSIFWSEIRNSCEANRIVTFLIVDFFFALHIDLNAWNRKNELMTNFFACCSRLCLRNNSLNLNVCLQYRHVVDFFVDFDSIFNVESERCEFFKSKIDFFSFSHIELSVLIERRELSIDFFRCCSRLCSRSDFLKLKISSQCLHVTSMTFVVWNNAIFIDFCIVSNVEIEEFERFNRVIASNVIADSNMNFWDFANEADDTCVTNDFFSISHTKLTALIERKEFLTSFRTLCLRICSYNFLLKLKLCLQSLQITRAHVIWKFDEFSIDFDMTSNVFNWKFERLETRRTDASENAFANALSKHFNEMNSNWVLKHSDARSHKHFDNKFSKSDLRYRCVEDVAKRSRFRYTDRTRICQMSMLNRRCQYFEVLMLTLHLLHFFSRFFDLLAFELLFLFSVVAKKRRLSELYWKCAKNRNVIAFEVI